MKKNGERNKVQLKCMSTLSALWPQDIIILSLLTLFEHPSEGVQGTASAKYELSFKHSAT